MAQYENMDHMKAKKTPSNASSWLSLSESVYGQQNSTFRITVNELNNTISNLQLNNPLRVQRGVVIDGKRSI